MNINKIQIERFFILGDIKKIRDSRSEKLLMMFTMKSGLRGSAKFVEQNNRVIFIVYK